MHAYTHGLHKHMKFEKMFHNLGLSIVYTLKDMLSHQPLFAVLWSKHWRILRKASEKQFLKINMTRELYGSVRQNLRSSRVESSRVGPSRVVSCRVESPGGTQKSFIRGGRKGNPFVYLFFCKKALLSYTFLRRLMNKLLTQEVFLSFFLRSA